MVSDRSSVQFNSYQHLLNLDGSAAEGHPNPHCAPPAERAPAPPPARPIVAQPNFTG